MKRTEFIAACLAVAAAGAVRTLPAAETEKGVRSLLPGLAGVVVPDPDPGAWAPGSGEAGSLARWWRALDAGRRAALARELGQLDSLAGGGGFLSLGFARRTALVSRLLEDSDSFREAFRELRSASISAFYSSERGRRRAGWRDTTQFEGYPEHLELAVAWEDL